jgi:hypothetical protein
MRDRRCPTRESLVDRKSVASLNRVTIMNADKLVFGLNEDKHVARLIRNHRRLAIAVDRVTICPLIGRSRGAEGWRISGGGPTVRRKFTANIPRPRACPEREPSCDCKICNDLQTTGHVDEDGLQLAHHDGPVYMKKRN